MADMITLHAPEPPKPPHKCDVGMYVGFKNPTVFEGAIIQCKRCGQLWYADREDKPGFETPIYTIFWRKVRWYHFELRKKARENG